MAAESPFARTDDVGLVIAVARYNADAFAEVYRRHGGAVFGLAQRLLWERALAEELLQEIFLRLWEHPERFDQSRGSLRSFLLMDAHARCVDRIRADSRRKEREERTARADMVTHYDLDLEAYDLDVAEQVREALATLSDGERRAIELAYFGGHTYREVARLLEQPEGTIKSRIRSGLTRLRTKLIDRGIDRVMDRELTPDELSDLLSAYAIDAVDDDERAAIEVYLDEHPESRDLVAEFQVAASMLAHAGGPPPENVWERLESIISTTPAPPRPVPPPVPLTPRSAPAPGRTRPGRQWRWLAAAAAVVALVFGSLWLIERGDGGGGGAASDVAALARTAATAPGARGAVLADTAGNTLATAVVTPDGSGYLTAEMPPAAPGHTYQLWGITRTGTISLGVLGRDPGVVAFKAAVPTTTLAITTEVAGGVPVSHQAPDAVGDIA